MTGPDEALVRQRVALFVGSRGGALRRDIRHAASAECRRAESSGNPVRLNAILDELCTRSPGGTYVLRGTAGPAPLDAFTGYADADHLALHSAVHSACPVACPSAAPRHALQALSPLRSQFLPQPPPRAERRPQQSSHLLPSGEGRVGDERAAAKGLKEAGVSVPDPRSDPLQFGDAVDSVLQRWRDMQGDRDAEEGLPLRLPAATPASHAALRSLWAEGAALFEQARGMQGRDTPLPMGDVALLLGLHEFLREAAGVLAEWKRCLERGP